MILCIRLFIVHLIIVAGKTMKYEKVTHIVDRNCGDGHCPSSLDEFVTSTAAIQDCADCHDGGNCGDEGPEASLCLPDAEALLIVKHIRLLLYLVCLVVAQHVPQKQLALQEGVDLGKGAWVLCTEEVAEISIFLISMGHWSLI